MAETVLTRPAAAPKLVGRVDLEHVVASVARFTQNFRQGIPGNRSHGRLLVVGLTVTRMMVSEFPLSFLPSSPWSTPKTRIEIGFLAAIRALVAVLPLLPFMLTKAECKEK